MKKAKIIFAALAVLAITSCAKKSDSPTDPRDALVGSYLVTDTTDIQLSQSIPASGYGDTVVAKTATVVISKDAGASDKVDIKETGMFGVYKYYANTITKFSTGTVFNIPSQLVYDSAGHSVTWTGNPIVSVGGVEYDGTLVNGKLKLNYAGDIFGDIGGTEYLIPFVRQLQSL